VSPSALSIARRLACALLVACAGPGLAHAAEPRALDCVLTLAGGQQSVQQLVDQLRPGQTGCIGPGVYSGDVVIRHGGTAGAPVTLRAVPARAATIRGQLRIADGANFVRVADVVLAGTEVLDRPSPLVNGDDAAFTGNDVANPGDSCFVLGDKVWGVAERTVIARNRIHHCGIHGTNRDHGVYVRQATDTVISANVIERNPDRGVQLYPNADRTRVLGNLIDRNGEGLIFSGDSVDTSDDNVVTRNIITRSLLRWDVESYWWRARGRGNVVRENCIAGGVRGPVQRPTIGFATARNVLLRTACRLPTPRFP
jgi:Right handed beta helix region